RVDLEPVRSDTVSGPLADCSPSLIFELVVRVRRDGPAAVRPSRHQPIDDPRKERGLADTVAAGDGLADRKGGLTAVEFPVLYGLPNLNQDIALPDIRPGLALDWPFVSALNEAQWVAVAAGYPLAQLR